MSVRKIDIAQLDKYYSPAGPCAFCGHRDKRHRLWDVIMGMFVGGDSIEMIAWDYNLSIEAIKAVIKIRPYRRACEI